MAFRFPAMAALRRILTWALGIAVLLAGAVWVLGFDLKHRVETALTEFTGARVTIGELSWTGLSRVTARAIVAEYGGKPVAGLGSLRMVGSPWGLLRRRVEIDSLEVVAPNLRVSRDASGKWDLPILNRPSEPRTGSSGWSLEIRHGWLRSGRIEIASGAARILTDSLNVDFGVRREGGGHAFVLSRLNALVLSPPLVVRRVDVAALLGDDDLSIAGMEITTQASHFHLSGSVRSFRDPQVDLTLVADPLSADEVRSLLPAFHLHTPLSLTGSVKGGATGLEVAASLRSPCGALDGRGRLNLKADPPSYDLRLSTRHLDLSRLLPEQAPPTDLNISITASGTGLHPDRADLIASVATGASTIGGAVLDSSAFKVRMNAGVFDAEGRVRIDGWGDAAGRCRIDLRASTPEYRVDAEVHDLNLAAATGNRSPRTNLSCQVELHGSGTDADSLDVSGRIRMRPSRVGSFRMDSGSIQGHLRGRRLAVDEVTFRAPAGSVRASGQVLFPPGRLPTYGGHGEATDIDLAAVTGDTSLRSDLDLRVEIAGDGTDELQLQLEGMPSRIAGMAVDRFAGAGGLKHGRWTIHRLDLEGQGGEALMSGSLGPLDSLDIRADVRLEHLPQGLDLQASGSLSGTLRGRWSGLNARANGRVDSLLIGGILVRDVNLDLDLRGLDASRPDLGIRSAASGEVTARAGVLSTSGLAFRDLIAGAHIVPGAADLALDIAPTDQSRIDAAGRVTFLPEGLSARLDTLFVDAGRVHIRNEGPCHFRYAYGGAILLDHARLTQAEGSLTVRGEVDAAGRIRAEARLDSLDLGRWEDLLGRRDGLAGLLRMDAVASGTLREPEVSGTLEIERGRVADFAFRRLSGSLAYGAGVSKVDLTLRQEAPPTQTKGLTLKGVFPLNPRPQSLIDARLTTDALDLSFLQTAFPELKEVKGNLRGDVVVSGTVGHPSVSGFVEVHGGALRVPEIGLRVNDATLRLDAEEGRLKLSDTTLKTRGGSLGLSGRAVLDGMRVRDFGVEGSARDFDVLDGKIGQLTLGGEVKASGTLDRPVVSWDLSVLRALLPIPKDQGQAPGQRSWFWDSGFYRGMTCRGRLRVPRNAWVRSPDFSAEVQGEVEATKEGEAFVLFGELTAIRGQYIFQNASFSITRGELRFRGTPDNDPDFYLVGSRRIARALPDATGRLAQDLLISIVVGGTLNAPKISLESDAPTPLDQADLLSYALFGRPSSQTFIGSFGGAGATADFQAQAKNLVAGITANRLKQTVGRELGLDVLEVELGQGKEPLTHLAVGKYVRPDLLLTFSQDVIEGDGQGQDRLGRKVSVEYDIGRSFGLSGSVDDQKKTALDLFWKKEW